MCGDTGLLQRIQGTSVCGDTVFFIEIRAQVCVETQSSSKNSGHKCVWRQSSSKNSGHKCVWRHSLLQRIQGTSVCGDTGLLQRIQVTSVCGDTVFFKDFRAQVHVCGDTVFFKEFRAQACVETQGFFIEFRAMPITVVQSSSKNSGSWPYMCR